MTTTILDQITTPPDPFTGESTDPNVTAPIKDQLPEDSDFDRIAESVKIRVTNFLQYWGDGLKFADALQKADVKWIDVDWAIRKSQTFKEMYDRTEESRRKTMCKRIEEAQERLASGDYEVRKGYYPPSVSAAQMLLQANDPRYKQGNQAPVNSVAIQINI